MKTYGGVEIYFHTYLISTIYGGERPASSPGPFNPLVRVADAHSKDSWVSPRAVNKDLLHLQKTEPQFLGRSLRILVYIVTELFYTFL
jgi:hypothetical protein